MSSNLTHINTEDLTQPCSHFLKDLSIANAIIDKTVEAITSEISEEIFANQNLTPRNLARQKIDATINKKLHKLNQEEILLFNLLLKKVYRYTKKNDVFIFAIFRELQKGNLINPYTSSHAFSHFKTCHETLNKYHPYYFDILAYTKKTPI